jgi:hypothetical protein
VNCELPSHRHDSAAHEERGVADDHGALLAAVVVRRRRPARADTRARRS